MLVDVRGLGRGKVSSDMATFSSAHPMESQQQSKPWPMQHLLFSCSFGDHLQQMIHQSMFCVGLVLG